MLKITPDPKFTADVEITVPGKKKPELLSMTFKYMPRDEAVAWFAKKIKENSTDLDTLMELILDWDGFDGPFPFNKENLKLILDNYPAAGGDIGKAYRSLLFESRVKN